MVDFKTSCENRSLRNDFRYPSIHFFRLSQRLHWMNITIRSLKRVALASLPSINGLDDSYIIIQNTLEVSKAVKFARTHITTREGMH